MNFSSKADPRRRLRAAVVVAALAALAALGACGGGTEQLDPFVAQRVLAFGDESSVITANGRKYGVNALVAESTTQIDCQANPLWVQTVAGLYGYVFAECPSAGVPTDRAFIRATVGARVADVATQVQVQIAAGGFRDRDLVTMLVGVHDVLDLYAQYPTRSEAELTTEARNRGAALARSINTIIGLGAKVIVSNLPDMGLSPYARQQAAAFQDINRAALISRLTTAFNEQLGVTVRLDGRFVGLVQADLVSQAVGRSPLSFGFSNIDTGVCTVALPDCTTATVVADPNAPSYLWADDRRFAPGWQNQLAQLAVERARRNPF